MRGQVCVCGGGACPDRLELVCGSPRGVGAVGELGGPNVAPRATKDSPPGRGREGCPRNEKQHIPSSRTEEEEERCRRNLSVLKMETAAAAAAAAAAALT